MLSIAPSNTKTGIVSTVDTSRSPTKVPMALTTTGEYIQKASDPSMTQTVIQRNGGASSADLISEVPFVPDPLKAAPIAKATSRVATTPTIDTSRAPALVSTPLPPTAVVGGTIPSTIPSAVSSGTSRAPTTSYPLLTAPAASTSATPLPKLADTDRESGGMLQFAPGTMPSPAQDYQDWGVEDTYAFPEYEYAVPPDQGGPDIPPAGVEESRSVLPYVAVGVGVVGIAAFWYFFMRK